ncbi:hypothetical protein JCM10207_008824 [Rhodosporidiobolus poonsookiae]
MGYDSEGSAYSPDADIPSSVPPTRGFSTDPDASASGAATPALTLMDDTAAPTPAASDSGTAEVTPAPEPAPAPKKSKALNFLKKKEPKTSINIKGKVYQIRDDEIVLPDDPRGEAKIDEFGNLLGGRSWKVHTFTSPLRANKQKVYLLSVDAARCAGFRDSLYFFRRNPMIHKLSCTQQEKDRLIELGRLSGNLKSRAVTMVSARNVFKVMGATFVQDGKYVFDDYYEDKAIEAGHQPGEPAFIEPYDPLRDTGTLATSKGNAPPGATSLGLNVLIGHPGKPKVPGGELITSQLGGGFHATFGGTGLQPFGKSWDPAARKAKPAAHLTYENWMLEYAQAARETNAEFARARRGNIGQVQVGLDIEEKEEDCWEWVEEEYTDDEDDEDKKPPVMQVDPPSAAPSPYAASPAPPHPSLAAPSPHLAAGVPGFGGASPSPLPPLPGAPSSASASPYPPPPFATHLPPGASPHLAFPSSSAAASPAPSHPATPAARSPTPKPKKKRLIRVYNPIRGVYDPETNVPHVYRSTQPTFAEAVRVDRRPRLLDEAHEGVALNGFGDADERQVKRVKLEDAAARAGAASVELVSDERAWALESGEADAHVGGGETDAEAEAVVFEAAMRAARGREPLLPGMWDFLGREGLVA